MKIEMVDLKGQYLRIKSEIDNAIVTCLSESAFINGPDVHDFQNSFQTYLGVKHVIACANGTDALQIAMMALELKPGDEVICPAFTYIATAEVIGLLGLTPVLVDVDLDSFNISVDAIELAITSRTKAIVPVHLFGQSSDMELILDLAERYNLFVIEDNAQAIGADYFFSNGRVVKTGTIGHIGCTSFFPSKNLGCYGDGGALMTNDDSLAIKIRMIANHGQQKKYYHKVIGCNSRLDTIQAAVLNIKLPHLDHYNLRRNAVANFYDQNLDRVKEIEIPSRKRYSSHVFHQYTIKVLNGRRDELKDFLALNGVPSMIYYPLPVYRQAAYSDCVANDFHLERTEELCKVVLSLPIHTEMSVEEMSKICELIEVFFDGSTMN